MDSILTSHVGVVGWRQLIRCWTAIDRPFRPPAPQHHQVGARYMLLNARGHCGARGVVYTPTTSAITHRSRWIDQHVDPSTSRSPSGRSTRAAIAPSAAIIAYLHACTPRCTEHSFIYSDAAAAPVNERPFLSSSASPLRIRRNRSREFSRTHACTSRAHNLRLFAQKVTTLARITGIEGENHDYGRARYMHWIVACAREAFDLTGRTASCTVV